MVCRAKIKDESSSLYQGQPGKAKLTPYNHSSKKRLAVLENIKEDTKSYENQVKNITSTSRENLMQLVPDEYQIENDN